MTSTAYGVLIVDRQEEVRYTAQKSPILYYWVFRAVPDLIRFRLHDSRAIAPLIETTIKSPPGPGFWPIRFDDYRIVLEEDVQYRWFVITADDEDPNREIILAQGRIEWIDPRLIQYYGRPCNQKEVLSALEAGIWYDAFACLNQLIEAHPHDDELRRLRAKLLTDAGINLQGVN